MTAAAAVGVGCSSKATGPQRGESTESTGTVGLSLAAAPGVMLGIVNYKITGPNSFTKSGPIDESNSTEISALIGGIPADTGYAIDLSATATGQSTSCGGHATFDVAAASTTDVMVHLQCRGAHTTGSVEVNGTVNVCPNIDELSVLPDEVLVGHSVRLQSSASDVDQGPSPITYAWTASSGTVADPAAANTTFTCTTPGPATITLNVSDGDCGDTASATVTCTGSGDAGVCEAGAPDAVGVEGGPVVDAGASETGAVGDTGTPIDASGADATPPSDTGGGGPGVDVTGTWAGEL